MEKSISQTLAEIRSKTSEPKSYDQKYTANGWPIVEVPRFGNREEVTLNENDVFPQINWQDNN